MSWDFLSGLGSDCYIGLFCFCHMFHISEWPPVYSSRLTVPGWLRVCAFNTQDPEQTKAAAGATTTKAFQSGKSERETF